MKHLLLTVFFAPALFTTFNAPFHQGIPSAKDVILPGNKNSQIKFFKVHRQGRNGVGIMWSISDTRNMLSFEVQRSYDGQYFNPIIAVPCNGGSRYFCKDDNVFPGYLYYRLAIHLIDGSTVYSQTDLVHIVRK